MAHSTRDMQSWGLLETELTQPWLCASLCAQQCGYKTKQSAVLGCCWVSRDTCYLACHKLIVLMNSLSSFTPFLPPFFGSALCFYPDVQAVSYSQATQVVRKTVGFSLWSTFFPPPLQSLPASQRAWRQGGALPRNWLVNEYGSQAFDLISNGEHLAPREPRQTGPRDLLPCVLLKVKMQGNKLDRVSRTSSCGKPIISDLSLKLWCLKLIF